MGVRDLRDAFNDAAAGKAQCSAARLRIERQGGQEWQKLEFDGTWADGRPFSTFSELLTGAADVNLAARDTALNMLKAGEVQP